MNDLSNTMDLTSTLIRAEALFRRFQRTVEAIDKKDNFPTPSVRQRRPVSSEQQPKQQPTAPQGRTSGAGSAQGASTQPQGAVPSDAPDVTQVISPQLRHLLDRKVDTLDSSEVKEHGGGVGN